LRRSSFFSDEEMISFKGRSPIVPSRTGKVGQGVDTAIRSNAIMVLAA